VVQDKGERVLADIEVRFGFGANLIPRFRDTVANTEWNSMLGSQ
jgi:hypothetical protein